MSAWSSVYLYMEEQPENPQKIITDVVRLSGAQSVLAASRTTLPEKGWAQYQSYLAGETDTSEPTQSRTDLYGVAVGDLHREYQDGLTLTICFGNCPLGERFAHAIAGIPEAIRNGFVAGDLDVNIGYHDLFETLNDPHGKFVARAFLSIGFCGNGCPRYPEKFLNSAYSLDAVQSIHRDLEGICGPLKKWMWCEV